MESAQRLAPFLGLVVAVLTLYIQRMLRRSNRIIVAQYAPPAGLSLIAAAELLGIGRRAIAAQVVDLAVRRSISVAPRPGTRRMRRRAGFILQLDALDGLDDDASHLVGALFPNGLGSTRRISYGSNRRLGSVLRASHRGAIRRLMRRGLARRRSPLSIILTLWRRQPVRPTAAAQSTVDHLFGLLDYIRLAEADRLQFLQSPSGAQLRAGHEGAARALILNERLLPWAVLFNLEREWSRQLDLHHRDTSNLQGVDLTGIDLDLVALGLAVLPDTLAAFGGGPEGIDGLSAVLDGLGAVVGDALGSAFSFDPRPATLAAWRGVARREPA